MVSRMIARARSSGHSFSRRLESNTTFTPAARAIAMAANTVSQALALMAWLMPDTCRYFAPRIRSAGRSAGVMRLAALPARR